MPFQSDKFGHKAYSYEPGEGQLVERSPDKRPSNAGFVIDEINGSQIGMLPVRGLGMIVMRAQDGEFKGLSIFTDEEIKFDPR